MPENARYDGGVQLDDNDSCVSVRSQHGRIYLCPTVSNQAGFGSTTIDLSPELCAELRGALKLAEEAAGVYHAESRFAIDIGAVSG